MGGNETVPSNGRQLGLQHLPLEMLFQICDHVRTINLEEEDPNFCWPFYKANASIARLCSCSKRMGSALTSRYLYDSVAVRPKSLWLLLRTLRERPELGASVRRLFIDSMWSLREFITDDDFTTGKPIQEKSSCKEEPMSRILEKTANIKFLSIVADEDFHLPDFAATFDKLEKLQLHCIDDGSYLIIDGNMSKLMTRAENLKTLVVTGPVSFSVCDRFTQITNLHTTMEENPGVVGFVNDAVAACTALRSLTYDVGNVCDSLELFRANMNHVMSFQSQNLQSLRVERTESMICQSSTLLDSLTDFVCLEHLGISSSFFARRDESTGLEVATPLLTKLPESIRTLDIRKEHEVINPQIVDLIMAHYRKQAYPHLTKLTLRIPAHIYAQADSGEVSGLATACATAEFQLDMLKVPSFASEVNGPGNRCYCHDSYSDDAWSTESDERDSEYDGYDDSEDEREEEDSVDDE